MLSQLDFIGAAIGAAGKLGAQALTSSAAQNAVETQDQGVLAAQLAQERQALAAEQLKLETAGLQQDSAAVARAGALGAVGGVALTVRDLALLGLAGALAYGLARAWKRRAK